LRADIPIVSFPQSIHFEHEENAKSVAEVFGNHSNLQMAFRDQRSYKFAEEYFEPRGIKIFYTPDMAFAMGQQYGQCTAPT